ncbi:MAG: sulfite exporter TauE/SafE family protein [Phycisphaerales bacterium]|jgi:sulfite exporter TauE/SafE
MCDFTILCHAIGQEVHWHEPEMTIEMSALLITAVVTGFLHTILGPDHYLPFIMISWARKWSTIKTAFITFLCGLGHIGSSVVIGIVGVALGLAVNKLEVWESSRGSAAAWLLVAFGLAYFVWGIRQAYLKKTHTHSHHHTTGDDHEHEHSHDGQHSHLHLEAGKASVTPWVLFAIFVFGPCEVLIPELMYPAARGNMFGLVMVTLAFGITTIATMLAVVMLARSGINFLPLSKLNRYSHALSGFAILLCGLAIVLLGL